MPRSAIKAFEFVVIYIYVSVPAFELGTQRSSENNRCGFFAVGLHEIGGKEDCISRFTY